MKRYPYLLLKHNDGIVMLNAIASIHPSTDSVVIKLVNGDLIECFSSKDQFEVYKVCRKLIAWIEDQNEFHESEFPHHVFDFNAF